jgi:hypothetical protein
LRLDHVAVRHLAASFQILADSKSTLRLIDSLLGSGVFPLPDQQAVICFGDRRSQSPASDLRLGPRKGLRNGGAIDAASVEEPRCKILMNNAPLAVDMHTVVGNVPPVGCLSIALRAKVLRPSAQQRIPRCPRLTQVFGRDRCVT